MLICAPRRGTDGGVPRALRGLKKRFGNQSAINSRESSDLQEQFRLQISCDYSNVLYRREMPCPVKARPPASNRRPARGIRPHCRPFPEGGKRYDRGVSRTSIYAHICAACKISARPSPFAERTCVTFRSTNASVRNAPPRDIPRGGNQPHLR